MTLMVLASVSKVIPALAQQDPTAPHPGDMCEKTVRYTLLLSSWGCCLSDGTLVEPMGSYLRLMMLSLF